MLRVSKVAGALMSYQSFFENGSALKKEKTKNGQADQMALVVALGELTLSSCHPFYHLSLNVCSCQWPSWMIKSRRRNGWGNWFGRLVSVVQSILSPVLNTLSANGNSRVNVYRHRSRLKKKQLFSRKKFLRGINSG